MRATGLNPLLEHQLLSFHLCGVEDIVVVLTVDGCFVIKVGQERQTRNKGEERKDIGKE